MALLIDRVLYCRGPGQDGNPCGLECGGHGEDLCSTHMKQFQRNDGKLTPIAKKVSQREHLINLYDRLAEADSDEEHDAAERAFFVAVKAFNEIEPSDAEVAQMVSRTLSAAIRRGIAAAKARGERGPGRPAAPIDPAEFNRLVHLGPSVLATVFRVSRATVYRFLKKTVSETPPTDGPRAARESP